MEKEGNAHFLLVKETCEQLHLLLIKGGAPPHNRLFLFYFTFWEGLMYHSRGSLPSL